jgi:hypothetical protein
MTENLFRLPALTTARSAGQNFGNIGCGLPRPGSFTGENEPKINLESFCNRDVIRDSDVEHWTFVLRRTADGRRRIGKPAAFAQFRADRTAAKNVTSSNGLRNQANAPAFPMARSEEEPSAPVIKITHPGARRFRGKMGK